MFARAFVPVIVPGTAICPTNRALASQSRDAAFAASYAGRKSAGFLPIQKRPVSPAASGELARYTPVSLSAAKNDMAIWAGSLRNQGSL